MEDEKIVALYLARDEQAVQATDDKYGGYCFTLANNILACPEDAEEAVSDTYWKCWSSIPPNRPRVFRMYLAKITRNLSFERWRAKSAAKRGGGELTLVLEELEDCVASPGSVEDRLNEKELARTIFAFLDTCPKQEHDFFLRRYFFVETCQEIGRRYGIQPDSVRRTLARTRGKLKKYLKKEGYAV